MGQGLVCLPDDDPNNAMCRCQPEGGDFEDVTIEEEQENGMPMAVKPLGRRNNLRSKWINNEHDRVESHWDLSGAAPEPLVDGPSTRRDDGEEAFAWCSRPPSSSFDNALGDDDGELEETNYRFAQAGSVLEVATYLQEEEAAQDADRPPPPSISDLELDAVATIIPSGGRRGLRRRPSPSTPSMASLTGRSLNGRRNRSTGPISQKTRQSPKSSEKESHSPNKFGIENPPGGASEEVRRCAELSEPWQAFTVPADAGATNPAKDVPGADACAGGADASAGGTGANATHVGTPDSPTPQSDLPMLDVPKPPDGDLAVEARSTEVPSPSDGALETKLVSKGAPDPPGADSQIVSASADTPAKEPEAASPAPAAPKQKADAQEECDVASQLAPSR